jgi:hypothetical protein
VSWHPKGNEMAVEGRSRPEGEEAWGVVRDLVPGETVFVRIVVKGPPTNVGHPALR